MWTTVSNFGSFTTETVKHILTDFFQRKDVDIPYDLTDLITYGSQYIDEIMKHLKTIKMFNKLSFTPTYSKSITNVFNKNLRV